MIMTFSGFKGYISALIFTCVFGCVTFVGAFEPCGNMSTRTRKLNEKGTELLERNLRGKCASALRCATTVANKLGPLLKSATTDDFDLVTEYSTEFDTKISLVVDAYTNYSEKFVGDLEILGDFNSWFKPRFSVLRELQDFASNWISQLIDIQPDDSASQVMSQLGSDTTRKARSETSRKSKSSTGSKRSSGVRSGLSGSVASVRLRESLEKATLMAEASHLAKKQELMRQELELSIAKESLDISTKLAIAEAKEGVLVSFEADGSLLSVSKSVKSVSPLVRGVVDNNAVTLEMKSAGEITTSSALDPTTDTCNKSTSVVCPSISNAPLSGCMNSPSEEAKPLSFLRQSEGLTETHLLVGLSDQMPTESLLQNQTGVNGTRDNRDQSRGARRPSSQSLPVDTPRISDSFVPESRQVSCHHQVQVGSDNPGAVQFQDYVSIAPVISDSDETPDAADPVVTGMTITPPDTLVARHSKLNAESPVFIPQDATTGTMYDIVDVDTRSAVQSNGAGNDNAGSRTLATNASSGSRTLATNSSSENLHMTGVLNKLADAVSDQRHRLPEVGLSKFHGDPLEYDSFIRCFDSRVAARTSDDTERLYYLEQFTSGTPREIVRSCVHMPAYLGYSEARKRLDNRYGDKFLLAQSYLKKLDQWPVVRGDDVKRLDEFTTFLIGCRNAMLSTDGVKVLDFPSSLRLIVSKLPIYLQDRWARCADAIIHQERVAVTFDRLVTFLEREIRIKLNPLFGKAAIADHTKKTDKSKGAASQAKKSIMSAATITKPDKVVVSSSQSLCTFCEFPHSFVDCRRFRKILHKDKLAFLLKHRLCFNCLQEGHRRSECIKKASCSVCSGGHPTALHRSVSSESPSVVKVNGTTQPVTQSNKVDNKSVSESATQTSSKTPSLTVAAISGHDGVKRSHNMPIVPVRVKMSTSDKEILTHAFLDGGSSDTLMTEGLMRRLGAEGRRTTVTLTTLSCKNDPTQCFAVSNVEVAGLNEDCYIPLPVVFTCDSVPVLNDQIPQQEDVDRWPNLSGVVIPFLDSGVEILIGNNVPKASEPWQVMNSVGDSPYAVKSLLGWIINGPLRNESDADDQGPSISVHRVDVDSHLDSQLQRFFNQDFCDRHVFGEEKDLSVEDRRFMKMVESQTVLRDGHYEVCLPLRNASSPMPNNRALAMQRLNGLKKKFRNDTFRRKYTDFIEDLFVKDHASRIPEEELSRDDGQVWYLPHHGVIHPHKDKLRVVLDASASFAGTSLNARLLSGPDLSSSLFGVLVRFRQEQVAFVADLECMFYQVKVPLHQRDLLRFLWWPQGDMQQDIVECRMHAHIFGATSSPAVAKFALRKTALDNSDSFSEEAVDTVNRSFYVDDCLKSVSRVKEAISLSAELRDLTRRGGFHLTQWISNSREVLSSIPETERGKNVKEVDLDYDILPAGKALGVFWSVEADCLGFHVTVPEKAATRRGILSVVSSLYDPLGIAAPFVLRGKIIVQESCRLRLGWDDPVPEDIEERWRKWLVSLPFLDQMSMPRCYKPSGFGSLASVKLHHFADASDVGYGCVTYLRFENSAGLVHCSFVFGKSRVAPLKQMTIPRMELAAAVLAVKVDSQLRRELDLPLGESHFWCDSTSVLGYIKNEQARFHMFVANRIAMIHENSSPSQWSYVPTGLNPADDASRGLEGEALVACDRWKHGPRFLWESEGHWPSQPKVSTVDGEDPEVKKVQVASVSLRKTSTSVLQRVLSHFSDWYRLRRFVALLRRALLGLKHSASHQVGPDPRSIPLRASDLRRSEIVIVQWVQRFSFPEEVNLLQTGKSDLLVKTSKLASLNPVLIEGVLRVGGRIGKAPLSTDLKHPIIIPADSHIAELIIRDVHEKTGHGGREQVLSRVREKFWIVSGNALTRKVLKACVPCRRRFGSPLSQRMADLPADRISPGLPPFTNTGVDYFGPFLVKQGRSQVKRYGALFTCLVTRAVHLEMSVSLDSDAFINTLRRFIARRGQVQVIRSDNGTNLVGAERELKQALQQWNSSQVESFLLQKGITWIFNAPGASHHGGSWERLIRSTRRVLCGLMKEQVLTDDSLTTLFAEVESILNSRPLTRTSSDPNDMNCLTPNHLLLLKDQQCLPPGIFTKEDNLLRRRWRQVQYLADLFWKRWVREYLPLLQERQKWLCPHRNVQVGDVVLIVDVNAPRSSWPLGKVESVYPDGKGLVRTADVKTKSSVLTRPVTKLVLVLEGE